MVVAVACGTPPPATVAASAAMEAYLSQEFFANCNEEAGGIHHLLGSSPVLEAGFCPHTVPWATVLAIVSRVVSFTRLGAARALIAPFAIYAIEARKNGGNRKNVIRCALQDSKIFSF